MLNGYLGIYQPPFPRFLYTGTGYDSFNELEQNASVYCIASDDLRTLIMIPLVPGFFETAYVVAKQSKYTHIYVIMPSMDMVFISDAYRLYYEIHVVLGKTMDFFCHDRFQILVTDPFYNRVHDLGYDQSYELGPMIPNHSTMNLTATVSFPNGAPTQNRNATDIWISFGSDYQPKTSLYFALSMTEKKADLLLEDLDLYDEIHMPFVKNIYGGMRYFDARKYGNSIFSNKLFAYGFQSKEEELLLLNTGGKRKEVDFYKFV